MNDYLQTKELYHHGVKGMKWGVIKEDYQMHKRTKQATKEGTVKGQVIGGLLGAAAGLGATYLLGKGHVFSKNSKGILADKYTGETYSSVSKQGRKRTLGMAFLGAYMGAKIGKYRASKKASEQNLKDIRYQNLSDRQKTQLLKSEGLKHSIDEIIEHSGVKGQRWGVRRYQNADGTLTEEGKRRYGTPEGFEAASKQASALEEATRAASSAANAATVFTNTQKGSIAVKKDYSGMTDQELQKRINRLNLERAYGDLSGDTKYVQTGKEKTREILQTVGAALAITATAIGIYNSLHNKGASPVPKKGN